MENASFKFSIDFSTEPELIVKKATTNYFGNYCESPSIEKRFRLLKPTRNGWELFSVSLNRTRKPNHPILLFPCSPGARYDSPA